MTDVWWDYEPSCAVGWVDDWLTAVRETICACMRACSVPVPGATETNPCGDGCVSMCPPAADGLLAASGCCQRLDVWRGPSQVTYRNQGCDDPVPELTVHARILRCRVDWATCSPGQAAGVNRALAADQSVLTDLVPGKLTSPGCCGGGLVAQRVTVQPVCEPCVGVQVTYQLQRP